MRRRRSSSGHKAFVAKEVACQVLLLAVLAGWAIAAIRTNPETREASTGATWATHVQTIYLSMAQELERHVAGAVEGGWAAIDRVVVLPPEGDAYRRFDFVTPRADGMRAFLGGYRSFSIAPDRDQDRLFSVKGRVPKGALGIRLSLDEFQARRKGQPDEFQVEWHARMVDAKGKETELVAPTTLQQSNVSLRWFVRRKPTAWGSVVWTLLGMLLTGGGLALTIIYYRLVAGTLRVPRRIAVPVNRLRASTGLVASSLVLLSGALLLIFMIFLKPDTGVALNPRRLHLDLVLDASEAALPSTRIGAPDHDLPRVTSETAATLAGALVPESGVAADGQTILPVSAVDFPTWLRRGLPPLLRSRISDIRISRGTSWRLFTAHGGGMVTLMPGARWTPTGGDGRRAEVARVLEEARGKPVPRGEGMPLPWDPEHVPPLDQAARLSLGLDGIDKDGGAQVAAVVLGGFQFPSLGATQSWLAAGDDRPEGVRTYAVMMPAIPRSALRPWSSLEGRLIAAHAMAERVALMHPEPTSYSWEDERIAALGEAHRAGPDVAVPCFASAGGSLSRIANYSPPRDLAAERAVMFAASPEAPSSLRSLGEDFKEWFVGKGDPAERVAVFTIPRGLLYVMVLGLGLVFFIAGVRAEQNAQGVPGWFPPILLLTTGIAGPVMSAAWLYTRGDTTRFVIFGYADLAYWGSAFLWLALVVAPVFCGRVRVGIRRDLWGGVVIAAAFLLAALVPALSGRTRVLVADASLLLVWVLSGGALAASFLGKGAGHSLRITLVLFAGVAGMYYLVWGWGGQDLPAIFLLAAFLCMVVSGWNKGVHWWQIERIAFHDRIAWLHPLNRLTLAVILTLTGAAVLYCSFPAEETGWWIRGYASYCLLLCVLPFLLCAALLTILDLVQREIT